MQLFHDRSHFLFALNQEAFGQLQSNQVFRNAISAGLLSEEGNHILFFKVLAGKVDGDC